MGIYDWPFGYAGSDKTGFFSRMDDWTRHNKTPSALAWWTMIFLGLIAIFWIFAIAANVFQ
jgi:hypothetical protein